MTEIVGVCLSQFHDDENSFELLLAYADGREIGHYVNRTNAQRIAREFANEFRAALSSAEEKAVEVKKLAPSDVFQVLAEFYRNGQFDFGHAPEMSRRLSALVDVPEVESEPVAWQTIETAPKDGSTVDLWGNGRRATDVAWGLIRDWMGKEREGWQHGMPHDFEPTHWMRVPTPPSPYGGDNGDGSATGTSGGGE